MKRFIILPQELQTTSQTIQSNDCSFIHIVQNQPKPNQWVKLQKHAIVLVKKGYKILTLNHQTYKILPNQPIFLEAGIHCISNIKPKNGSYEAYLFFFDHSFLCQLSKKYQSFLSKSTPLSQGAFWIYPNLDFMQSIQEFSPINSLSNAQITQQIITLKFEEIFLYLLHEQSFCQLINYLIAQSHLNSFHQEIDPFVNVQEMAQSSQQNLSNFSKQFKKSFGVSPKKWIDSQRLLKAKTLIETSSKNINEICSDCGFSSPSWFIKRFKEKYKQTPKQYQKSKNLYF